MKKIFLIAVVLLMMINFIINYHHEVTKEQHTPMADFKTKVEMAPMKEYNDPDFGYVIKYPCFFQQEASLSRNTRNVSLAKMLWPVIMVKP